MLWDPTKLLYSAKTSPNEGQRPECADGSWGGCGGAGEGLGMNCGPTKLLSNTAKYH